MLVKSGPKITLKTKNGEFQVQHIVVMQKSDKIREGVLMEKEIDNSENNYVRIQSSCLFSESFWATDCDCALQLHTSMKLINEKGGYLLYFYEEGRGAGLDVKFKAIELQQVLNFDTQAAYQCLDFKVDERSYEAAAAVLQEAIGNRPIILLTNNESKVNGLKANGINVKTRESLVCGYDDPTIRKYLEEKERVLGHIIK